MPEPVGGVARVDGEGGLPIRAGLDETGLGDEPERDLQHETLVLAERTLLDDLRDVLRDAQAPT
jgi:hypothetical protein